MTNILSESLLFVKVPVSIGKQLDNNLLQVFTMNPEVGKRSLNVYLFLSNLCYTLSFTCI